MKKKNLVILVIAAIVIIVTIVAIITMTKKEDNTKTTFSNNSATSDIVLEEIEFKNITKEFKDGVTTLRADVYNNTKQEKSINVKIVLKDSEGKELTNMIQSIESIIPNGKKRLQTGIVGNYENVDNIEFKVLSEYEIQQYNQ